MFVTCKTVNYLHRTKQKSLWYFQLELTTILIKLTKVNSKLSINSINKKQLRDS